ncbi:MAG: UDP-N-acetylmuramoyl-L-alanine--D-glutamate ligase [Nitrospira sp.]|nr:UDP-N-acetylmuramoyl-L-alanine--D-glutamate ligase [Nitrospira sp.]
MEKKSMNKFTDKRVLVVGCARSGTGAANLLSFLGARVTITDRRPAEMLKAHLKGLKSSITVVTGEIPVELFESAELIVISPGVPLTIPEIISAMAAGVAVIGELELAYQVVMLAADRPANSRAVGVFGSETPPPHFTGITGTNGKSTVTTLVDLMYGAAGFNSLLGGNIGNALTEEILKCGKKTDLQGLDYIVAEISSFQLETISEFAPFIAAILNITPDHMDRYVSLQDYINAKFRIFEKQTKDGYLVLNADDQVLMKAFQEIRDDSSGPQVFFFSRQHEVKGVFVRDGLVYCSLPQLEVSELPLIALSEIRIKGVHNLENAMAAALIALLSGCPYQAIRDVLMSFSGLEHRLEYAGEVNGVQYINDSKGTNTGAVAMSLQSFSGPVVLIMGGSDKDSDFGVLKDVIGEKVSRLILLGEAAGKIKKALGDAVEMVVVGSLREAVLEAASQTIPGDTVLLSPACASFDMFVDFEDRGRQFKKIVKELAN